MDSWLYVALIAHFLYALVFIFDKYILSRPIKSSLSYAFYTSFAGGFIAIIIPFYEFRILDFTNILYEISLPKTYFELFTSIITGPCPMSFIFLSLSQKISPYPLAFPLILSQQKLRGQKPLYLLAIHLILYNLLQMLIPSNRII